MCKLQHYFLEKEDEPSVGLEVMASTVADSRHQVSNKWPPRNERILRACETASRVVD